ncbi:hypothetical protein PV08_03801 [Exophiala spinifera]|uniref:Uncharacterized protein n=1 Tax=Exophiala spinifera TaxID=91928 RepID=A0A0D2BCB5_9EURO|nr:uncharacterized protein PV08_03801 [Exophiala spinifera]KIW16613.1 hypothetical protein PV08_03801 [Exophiala spinifera]
MSVHEITGNIQSRFVQVTTLLHLIDPVRGEPTVYGLDQGANAGQQSREKLLKKRFLDSVALICARRKDGDTVSAACLEEGLPEGTVVRIASNQGVSDSTLTELREIIHILNGIASGEYGAADKESEVLARITSLDISRIRTYLKDIRNIGDDVEGIFESSGSASALHQIDYVRDFREWCAHIVAIRHTPPGSGPELLVEHLRWATEARRTYLSCLQALFPDAWPKWARAIFKLGRYVIASRVLLQFASDYPTFFNPMLVLPATAPPKARFTCSQEEKPLATVLRRLSSVPEVDKYSSRLAQIWGVRDPEAHFRDTCTLDLAVHAEMQLLNFYDSNPTRTPPFRFIGVSKRSCFLCQTFLGRHPQSFGITSSHQKLYLTWRPPPTTSPAIYRQYKTIIRDLSTAMESVAKQDLQNRLGLRRRVPADSTAGVSISGLTDHNRTSQHESLLERVTPSPESVVGECTPSSLQPIPVVDTSSSREESFCSTYTNSPAGHSFAAAEMVFHVMRPNEPQKQDIIGMRDVIDAHTDEPSWPRLVDLLMDDSGVGFGRGDYLMVNNQIRVGSERQFLACLQYLRNEMILNCAVYVYNSDTISPNIPRQVE